MQIILRKELGLEIVNGELYQKVSKYAFQSPAVAYNNYVRLNDEGYVILFRKVSGWIEIPFEELKIMSEKVRKKLGTSYYLNKKRKLS